NRAGSLTRLPGLGETELFQFDVERADIDFQLSLNGKMTTVICDPDRKLSSAARQVSCAKHRGLDPKGVDASQNRVNSFSFNYGYRHAKDAARVSERNIKRLANFQTLRSQKIDNREHILNWLREIQSCRRSRAGLVWIAFGPGHFVRLMIEDSLAETRSLTLFIQLTGSQCSKRVGVDHRFDMLMEMKAGHTHEQTFTDDVSHQANG